MILQPVKTLHLLYYDSVNQTCCLEFNCLQRAMLGFIPSIVRGSRFAIGGDGVLDVCIMYYVRVGCIMCDPPTNDLLSLGITIFKI